MERRWIEQDSDATGQQLSYRLFYQPHSIDEAIVHTKEAPQDSHAVVAQEGQVLADGRLAQENATEFRILQMVVERSRSRETDPESTHPPCRAAGWAERKPECAGDSSGILREVRR